jgi:hypothetical protein
MANITTRVSTNSDASINTLLLKDGHPMAPDLGVLNLAFSPYGTMFKHDLNYLLSQGSFKLTHAGFYGIYGPAWAMRADVEAAQSADGSMVELKITNDALKAGVQWGASHAFQVSYVSSEWKFKQLNWQPVEWGQLGWPGYWWPEFSWEKNNDLNIVIPIDFIKIVYEVLKYLQNKAKEKQDGTIGVAEPERQGMTEMQSFERALPWTDDQKIVIPQPPLAGISAAQMIAPTAWGLTDEAQNTFNKNGMTWALSGTTFKNFHNGEYMEMKAYPGLVQAVDIWQILVVMDKNTKYFSGSLEAFDKVLKDLWSGISLGASLGILFPFQLGLENILFNNTVYGDLTFDSVTNIVTGLRMTPAPDMGTYNSSPAGSDIDLYFKFSTGIDFRLGFFASVTLLKVIKLGFALDFNIFEDWFNLHPRLKQEGVNIGGSAGYSPVADAVTDDIEVVFA